MGGVTCLFCEKSPPPANAAPMETIHDFQNAPGTWISVAVTDALLPNCLSFHNEGGWERNMRLPYRQPCVFFFQIMKYIAYITMIVYSTLLDMKALVAPDAKGAFSPS